MSEEQYLREVAALEEDRPRLFLDVDGVLNALPYDTKAQMWDQDIQWPSAWGDEWRVEYVERQLGDFMARLTLTWSPNLIDSINEVLARPDGPTLWWATTWLKDAQDVIEPLMGIDAGPRGSFVVGDEGKGLYRSLGLGGSIHWKMANIEYRLQHYRIAAPWVHFDDELLFTDQGRVKTWREEAPAKNGLALPPDEIFGISPDDWQQALNHWGLS